MPSPAPQTLDYASPAAQRPSWLAHALITAAFTALGLLLVTFAIELVVPWIAGIYLDFRVSLPAATQALLVSCRAFHTYYGWALIWCVPPLVGWLVHWPARHRRDAVQMLTATLATMIVELFLLLFAAVLSAYFLFSPMITIMGSVSGGKK